MYGDPELESVHLFDKVATSQFDHVGATESGDNLPAGNKGQPLDAVKVGVLDGHNAGVGEQLLGVVVDQLPVDEHSAVVLQNQFDLLLHLLLLGQLQFGHFGHWIDADTWAEHLQQRTKIPQLINKRIFLEKEPRSNYVNQLTQLIRFNLNQVQL